jgi:hypothetical protein
MKVGDTVKHIECNKEMGVIGIEQHAVITWCLCDDNNYYDAEKLVLVK